MAYETRASKIFDNMDITGLEKNEIIELAMQEHNLKKITATNYYYEWSRMNKTEDPGETKTITEDEAAAKILEIIGEKPAQDVPEEVKEWTKTDNEEDAAAKLIAIAADMQIDKSDSKFKIKKLQFSGDNGEYYIDKDCFKLSNVEGSLTFSAQREWDEFKSEIDQAFKYFKNMEVLQYE